MDKKEGFLGLFLTLIGAVLWGVSGGMGQQLFHHYQITPQWLAGMGMLGAGILLLSIIFCHEKKELFSIWKNKTDVKDLVLFAILGILATQVTYFGSVATSGVEMATVLQYLAPAFIMIYTSVRLQKRATVLEIVAVNALWLGCFILISHGNPKALQVSQGGMLLGLLSAAALAFYCLQPKRLLREYNPLVLAGWAMLIGGIVMSVFAQPWKNQGVWNGVSISYVLFIIVCGTMIPFSCFLVGIKMFGAKKAGFFASFAPLAACGTSVLWLGGISADVDCWGVVLIVCTVAVVFFSFCTKQGKDMGISGEKRNREQLKKGTVSMKY